MAIEELVFVAFVCFFAVVMLNAMAPRLGLVDVPSKRKSHTGDVPLVGGIAFYIATFSACAIVFPVDSSTIQLFLISCGLIVLLGSVDDYRSLGVPFRLFAQFMIASILIFSANAYIHDLGDIFGLGQMEIKFWGIGFTFAAILSLINAFNMCDGIDGLAGALALNAYICIAILFQLQGASECPELPIILIAGILPFLLFNLGLVPGPVAKVFLGDAGSMFIGLSIIWLFVLGSQGEQPAFRPVTALWIVAIPLWDMTAIVYRRLRQGLSPFRASRDHLHHIFLKFGFNSKQALLIILSISIVTSGVGLLGEYLLIPEYIMLPAFVVCFLFYNFCLMRVWVSQRWDK